MIRALYTAASGMNAQQANIDNIAHNLANVNTTGFKKCRVEFEDLVYQQIKAPGSPTSHGRRIADRPRGRPRLARGGDGAQLQRAATCARPGRRSTSPSKGTGFFQVSLPGGETGYTRAGMFHVSGQGEVVTNEGYPLEPAITIPRQRDVDHDLEGRHRVGDACPVRARRSRWARIELAQFQNPAGLEARGGNIFVVTNASGDPTTGVPGTDGLGTLVQGFVEDSNVSVVEEMVNMILGQRAYEANSKVIRAADEMLQQVNGLAR